MSVRLTMGQSGRRALARLSTVGPVACSAWATSLCASLLRAIGDRRGSVGDAADGEAWFSRPAAVAEATRA